MLKDSPTLTVEVVTLFVITCFCKTETTFAFESAIILDGKICFANALSLALVDARAIIAAVGAGIEALNAFSTSSKLRRDLLAMVRSFRRFSVVSSRARAVAK